MAVPNRPSTRSEYHDIVRLASIIFLATLAASLNQAGEWPRFRGPNGSGVSDDGKLPREIGPGKNVVWKTAIPGGKSSPVLTSDRIYLTGHESGKLLTLALDRKTGRIVWRRDAPDNREEKRNKLNDAAAPTPATDGSNVYVFFAGYGLISYDRDGRERWKLPLGPFRQLPWHGCITRIGARQSAHDLRPG